MTLGTCVEQQPAPYGLWFMQTANATYVNYQFFNDSACQNPISYVSEKPWPIGLCKKYTQSRVGFVGWQKVLVA